MEIFLGIVIGLFIASTLNYVLSPTKITTDAPSSDFTSSLGEIYLEPKGTHDTDPFKEQD